MAGSPVIGFDNDIIYFSHNVPNTVDNGELYRGKLTIVRDNGGTPTVVAEILPEDRFGPFGPVTAQTAVVNAGENRDVVFVAESWGEGLGTNGHVYYLFPSPSDGTYELQVFSDFALPSVTRPAVGEGADKLWLAGGGSIVAGWVGDSSFLTAFTDETLPVDPAWNTDFDQSADRKYRS